MLKRSLHYIDKLIIGIGSANVANQNNPLSLEIRRKMLDLVIKKESHFAKASRDKTLRERVLKIVPINDYLESDELWLKKALEAVGKFNVLIGNDEWTDGIFEKAGYKVLRLGFYKRYLYEGTKIRKLIADKKSWEQRVPGYIVKYIREKI